MGKSCPALFSEPGLILLKAQGVRGSVGSLNAMVGDRLELDACDLELVCTLYLVPSTFEVSVLQGPRGEASGALNSIRLNHLTVNIFLLEH